MQSLVRAYRHLLFVLGCVWLGAVLYVALRHLSGLLTLRDFQSNPAAFIRSITTYYWSPWLLLAPAVAMLAHRLPLRPDRWLAPLAANVGLFVALAVAHGLLVGYVYHYFGNVSAEMMTYEPWQHSGHFLFGDAMFLFDAITFAVLAGNLNIGNFHRIVQRQELDAARLSNNLAQLRLQTLRMQVNPHFLFNALNAVAVLVRKSENARAVDMIGRISNFFRRTLDEDLEQLVPLQRELEMTAEYLAIAKLRYGDRLATREHCSPDAAAVPVPAMLLQPLIENAVVHGVAEKPGACCLTVDCRLAAGRLVIEIADDGVGYDPARSKEGVGLRNVRQRLEQLYGHDHSFLVAGRRGEGTRITIDIPARSKAEPPAVPKAAA